jgi:hypothetical protein
VLLLKKKVVLKERKTQLIVPEGVKLQVQLPSIELSCAVLNALHIYCTVTLITILLGIFYQTHFKDGGTKTHPSFIHSTDNS